MREKMDKCDYENQKRGSKLSVRKYSLCIFFEFD